MAMGLADTGNPAVPANTDAPPFAPCACGLTSEAGPPAPINRKVLGLGEVVIVRASGPATWEVTGEGTATSKDTTWIKVTAGERSGKLTVTATVDGCSCSIEFTVFPPIARMRQQIDSKTRHSKGSPTCGFLADLFLEPKEVSFAALTVREKDSLGNAGGFYLPFNGTGHRDPRGSTSKELNVSRPTGQTSALGSQVIFGDNGGDEIWSGDPRPGGTGPITEGSITYPFSYEYRVGTGSTWYKMMAVDDQHFVVDDKGTCQAYKAGAKAEAALGADESGYR
jgi:hypothetical protein